MIKTRLFSIIAFLLLSLILLAKPSLADPLYDQCLQENRHGTNLDLGDCARDYMDRLDRQLNATWKIILASYDEHPKTKEIRASLIDEQRQWLNYR